MTNKQLVYFFFDDSGIFHSSNPSGYFVYAGYIFFSKSEKDSARRQYQSLNKKIRSSLHRQDELKACSLRNTHRRALLNVLKKYERLALVVTLHNVHSHIIEDKYARVRYKDFILKQLIKEKVKLLIAQGKLDPNLDTQLIINIDEQSNASSGIYDLKTAIIEEFRHGISNWNYNAFMPPIFTGELLVDIKYCHSDHEYLIQAADILANYIHHQSKNNLPIKKIFTLHFPQTEHNNTST